MNVQEIELKAMAVAGGISLQNRHVAQRWLELAANKVKPHCAKTAEWIRTLADEDEGGKQS